MTIRSKLAVILHADVVGSTGLVRSDEQIAHDRIQDAFRRFSATIVRHEGTAHEIRGDALVAEFNRASDAVSAALAFQAENGAHNQELPGEIRPEVRIGIAMGEVVIGDNTLTGVGVVLAQRIEQLAEPGALCISAAVHEALPGRLPVGFTSLGDQSLKGFADPVRVYAVSLRAGEAVPEPVDDISLGDRIGQPVMPSSRFSDKPSIAVLPFNNLSSDSEQDYFADGMTEDIITGLSRFRSLFVTARNSSFAYKGMSPDVREVARDLGVRYVLEDGFGLRDNS
jgi:adenylate cyclase